MIRPFALLLPALLSLLPITTQASEDPAWQLTVESGPLWFSRNDIQIPNDDAGDRFDLLELTGQGPEGYLRVGLEFRWREHHSFTALYAPLRVSGEGRLQEDTRFAGETFRGGEPVKGTYQFDTYRLGWRYHWLAGEDWQVRAGISLLIREANVRLIQNDTTADDPNLGFVPLLGIQATRQLSKRWALDLDLEGLGAPQGRAIDASVAMEVTITPELAARFGYRTLEGGGDNDSVYTFAWLHYGLAGLRYRF